MRKFYSCPVHILNLLRLLETEFAKKKKEKFPQLLAAVNSTLTRLIDERLLTTANDFDKKEKARILKEAALATARYGKKGLERNR